MFSTAPNLFDRWFARSLLNFLPVDVRTYVRYIHGMRRTATDLRAHLYEILDQVAKTGEPVDIVKGGVELCIVRKEKAARRKKRAVRALPNLIVGNPDDLIHMEWPWSKGRGL